MGTPAHTAESGHLRRRGQPNIPPREARPAASITHNYHFLSGSASSLTLYNCLWEQQSDKTSGLDVGVYELLGTHIYP